MTQKNSILVLAIALIASCSHKPSADQQNSSDRCIATAGATCNAVFTEPVLNAQQAVVKDAILKALADEGQWPKIVQTLDTIMPQIEKLSSEGKLQPALMVVAQKAFVMGKLPARITKDNLAENVAQLTTMIENQFIAKGMSKKHPLKYVSWLEASRKIRNAARATAVPPHGPESASALSNPVFIKELEVVAESKFKPAQNVHLLVNGPRSFPVREQLIKDAKESIYVMSWAFESDVTGKQFAKLLAEKYKAGVDVRIIVDNKTAQQSIYGEVPAWLKEQGVPVIQWKDPSSPMYAFHKKIMIVDGEHVVGGGMNFGDVYSHLGPETTPKWRDTDFQASGNAAADAFVLFKNTWNSQVDKNKLPLAKISKEAKTFPQKQSSPNDVLIMVIDQVPNPTVKDPILTSIVKGIEGATKEINIENAYFIENPALQQSLLQALKRGVKVRIFTNSANSIDVPIIAKPILEALPIFQRNGAEVYLKKGPTLHSKFMTVDGEASWVMSYNHHPQSMRTQGENAFVILDKNFTRELTEQFHTDTQTLADRVTDISQLQPEKNLLDIILQRYFFDQL